MRRSELRGGVIPVKQNNSSRPPYLTPYYLYDRIGFRTFFPELNGYHQFRYFLTGNRVVNLHVHSVSSIVTVAVGWCFARISKACPVFHANEPVWVVHHGCTVHSVEPTMRLISAQRLLDSVHVRAQGYWAPGSAPRLGKRGRYHLIPDEGAVSQAAPTSLLHLGMIFFLGTLSYWSSTVFMCMYMYYSVTSHDLKNLRFTKLVIYHHFIKNNRICNCYTQHQMFSHIYFNYNSIIKCRHFKEIYIV